MYFAIWKNWEGLLETYFKDTAPVQIYLAIYTNIFGNLNKYILKLEQIYLAIWTNVFWNLNKYIWQFIQIYLAIWTDIFGNLKKKTGEGLPETYFKDAAPVCLLSYPPVPLPRITTHQLLRLKKDSKLEYYTPLYVF